MCVRTVTWARKRRSAISSVDSTQAHQLQDLGLPIGQVSRRRSVRQDNPTAGRGSQLVHDLEDQPSGEPRFPGEYPAQRVPDPCRIHVLEQVPRGAGPEGGEEVLVVP